MPPVAVTYKACCKSPTLFSIKYNQPFVASIYCKRREARLVVISELVAAPWILDPFLPIVNLFDPKVAA